MASIEKRPDGRYRARWREYPGGPQRAQHFDRRSDAQRFLDRIRGDLARGDYIDPSAGRVTFRDYAETWRRGQVHRPSTVVLVESLADDYLALAEEILHRITARTTLTRAD